MIVYADDVAAFEARLLELGLQRLDSFDGETRCYRLEPFWDSPPLQVQVVWDGELPRSPENAVESLVGLAAMQSACTDAVATCRNASDLDAAIESVAGFANKELDRLAFVAKRDGLAWGQFIDAARRKLMVGGADVAVGNPNAG